MSLHEPPCLFVILLVCCFEEVGDNFCNVSLQVANNPFIDTSSQSLQAQPLEPKTEPINETTMEGVPNLPPHLQGEFMQNLEQMQMKDSLS